MPENAIEYCYNRNKRDQNGKVLEAYKKWYLPAIDEMEAIMMGGHDFFDDFHGQFYWSCQPAYVVNYARSTGVWGLSETITGKYFRDDIGVYYWNSETTTSKMNNGYARATKAISLGYNQFDYARSGTSGYDDAMILERGLIGLGSSTKYYRTNKKWNIVVLDNIIRDDGEMGGNHERSTKHRVRAVYVNTSTTSVSSNTYSLKGEDNQNGVIDSDGWIE